MSATILSMQRALPRRRTGAAPLVGEDRPERRVEVLVAARQGAAKNGLAHRPDLAERGTPSLVGNRGTRLHAPRAERLEREAQDQLRSVDEDPASPELSGDREAPF